MRVPVRSSVFTRYAWRLQVAQCDFRMRGELCGVSPPPASLYLSPPSRSRCCSLIVNMFSTRSYVLLAAQTCVVHPRECIALLKVVKTIMAIDFSRGKPVPPAGPAVDFITQVACPAHSSTPSLKSTLHLQTATPIVLLWD